MTQGQAPEFQTINEMTAEPTIQGVCKDCGNGTLNNALNPAFDMSEFSDDNIIAFCLRCGSSHVDLVEFNAATIPSVILNALSPLP